MIWRNRLVNFNRLIIAFLLRPLDDKYSQVCCSVIQLLIFNHKDLIQRSSFWASRSSSLEDHQQFYKLYEPKRSIFEKESNEILPCYYDNTCFRFLPIMDLLFSRFIAELGVKGGTGESSGNKQFFNMLFKSSELIKLYKFHPKPIGYLYKMFVYHEDELKNVPEIKRQLFWNILTTKNSPDKDDDSHTSMSKGYIQIAHPPPHKSQSQGHNSQRFMSDEDYRKWEVPNSYFEKLIHRLADTMYNEHNDLNLKESQYVDYLNYEYNCRSTHMLYATCVELLTLPEPPMVIAKKIIAQIRNKKLLPFTFSQRCNVVSLILTNLPRSYREQFNLMISDQVASGVVNNLQACLKQAHNIENLNNEKMEDSETISKNTYPFLELFKIDVDKMDQYEKTMLPTSSSSSVQSVSLPHTDSHFDANFLLAFVHTMFHQISVVELTLVPEFLKKSITPIVNKEEQFLYICHLIGPCLHRLHDERTRVLRHLIEEMYHILEKALRNCNNKLQHMEIITDILYYYKYKFIGNDMDDTINKVMPNLPQCLQEKLKFVVLNKELSGDKGGEESGESVGGTVGVKVDVGDKRSACSESNGIQIVKQEAIDPNLPKVQKLR